MFQSFFFRIWSVLEVWLIDLVIIIIEEAGGIGGQ